MSRIIPVANFTVRHIWEAYALKLLAANPDWRGVRHNKIANFYLYRKDDKGVERPALSYTIFRKVLEIFFMEARKAITFRGEALHLNECGKILATRVQRKHHRKKKRKAIDWGKTRQQNLVWDETLNRFRYAKVIYFTNDDYCCINWLKNRVKNSSFYQFEPTTESSASQTGSKTPGFKRSFVEALNNNKLLKYKYLYAPLQPRKLREEEPEDEYSQH